ncbi:hypothetical protein F5B21DRAFT_148108 [Xylaria acuta]|nr:hypothetical protein F5B21DRAFT_148108 [Xylaria acuta]
MCCGSSDDYYTVAPYRPRDENPHPSVSRGFPQRYTQPPPRDPIREEIEKRQRQAQATAAAQRYGWPTSRGASGSIDHLRTLGNRDSIIEPNLAGSMAATPIQNFGEVYDPRRPPRQQNYSSDRPRPTQRPPYHGQRIVDQQPGRMPPMNAPPTRGQPRKDVRTERPVACQRHTKPMPPRNAPPIRAQPGKHVRVESPAAPQRPAIAREVVVQKQDSPPPGREFSSVPQPTRSIRRDSNRVSLCSDNGFDFRSGSVSPISD